MAFDSSKAEQIKSVLAERLDADKDDSHPVHLDGVISCNDYVAKNIADELDKLGYTGSSADINLPSQFPASWTASRAKKT